MTRTSRHPWPTDGVTYKQLDRAIDRQTRRVDHWADKVRRLEATVLRLEEQMTFLVATNLRLAEFLAEQGE